MKETFYFPHDTNAHSDPRMMKLCMKHWLSWIGMYWILIEHFHSQDDWYLTQEEVQDIVNWNASREEDPDFCEHFLNTCSTSGLICSTEDWKMFSKRVLKNKQFRDEIKEKRSFAWRESARKRALQREKTTSVEQNLTNAQQGKERKGNKKENEIINNISKDTEIIISENSEETFWKTEINELIQELKNTADSLWVAYDKTNDRNFAKHILTAKEYWSFCEKIWQWRIEFAKNVMIASLKIKYWQWVASWPYAIYKNYSDIYNKSKLIMEDKNKKKIVNIPTVDFI